MNSDLLVELGAPFLAYVLASDAMHVQTALGDNTEVTWSDGQSAVLEQLRALRSIYSKQEPAELRGIAITDVYGQFVPDGDTTLANVLRSMAGGDISGSPVNNDPVSAELATLARDAYPILLLPSDSGPFSGGISRLSVNLFYDPHSAAFQTAVMADAILSQLFPGDSEHTGRTGYNMRSTGQGGTNQLAMLASQLITAGWELALLESATPSLAEYLRAVEEALGIVRKALSGKQAEVPVRIGLTGVVLPDDTKIDFGWAVLRPADDRDRHHAVCSGIDGSVQATTPSGEVVATVNYSGDIVMEASIPYSVVVREFKPGQETWPIDRSGWERIEHKLESLRLGLLLAINDNQRALVLPTWFFVVDPLGNTSYRWHDWRRTSFMPRALDAEAVAKWKQWAERIDTRRKPGIDVAVRRALLAAAERQSPEDVLVDAIVVWENLFGSSQDTTMRVTGALAWLLATDTAEREQEQQRLKKIYELRSKVVHGARQMTTQEMQTFPQEALDVALEALRRIFQTRPDLIDLNDSNARSNRMLLGG